MRRNRDTTLADLTAGVFLQKFGLDCGMRLEDIAREIGLVVKELDVSGFDGALLRVVGVPAGTVVVRDSIREPGRKRFTLAHEIGHYVLPNQQTLREPCLGRDVETWKKGLPEPEADANRFAAEILMPRTAIQDLLAGSPSLGVASSISGRLGVSLTAAAYRLAELSSYRTAMVISRNGSAEWYRASVEFGRGVRLGPLDPGTVAYDLFQGQLAELGSPVDVAADSWLSSEGLPPRARVRESSTLLSSYDTVVTVLDIFESIEDVSASSLEEGLESLDPTEFTLRRKWWPVK